MPKVTKILGNNKARAWESLGFAHKKRLCQHFDTFTFPFRIEARTRFHRIQVMMTHNQSVWKDALQFAQQCKQRSFLL